MPRRGDISRDGASLKTPLGNGVRRHEAKRRPLMYDSGMIRRVGLFLGCLMGLAALAVGDQSSAPPSGASAAWTSDDPIMLKARHLILNGDISEAEELLRS